MEKEIRQSIKATFSGRRVSGYACLFESESNDLGGFVEVISRRALDGVLEKSDVLALLNHNTNSGILARYRKGKGSLKLSIDSKGLRYEFEAPDTALGNELVESLKRGDIDESSFAFTVEDEEWSTKSNGIRVRRIKRFKRLYDVSPVYYPAYEGTKVGVRAAEDVFAEAEKKRWANYTKVLNDYYRP